MKKVILTFDFPPIIGGIAHALSTSYRLAGDPDCLILAPSHPQAAAFDCAFPIRTIRFPALSGKSLPFKLANGFLALLWCFRILRKEKPDLLIGGQVVRAGPIAHFWHTFTGCPFDLWVYGGETSPRFTPFPPLTRLLRHILRSARTLFTISPFITREMREFGIAPENLAEIPLGVDPTLFYPAPKNADYLHRMGLERKLVLLTVGRLVERKGTDRMLEALAKLSGSLPEWHYLIVGEGPYRGRLEALAAALGIRGRVTFTGAVTQEELPVYYNLCDIFAMPNREVAGAESHTLSVEGFGMVFIEAAACAKPVIAGRSGGAVDAVADKVNGFLVDPNDLTDIKRAIVALSDPRVRERMGRAGVEFAARFTWEKSAEILKRYLI